MMSQLSVLHLAAEPFTARDVTRYWLTIAIFVYRTCIRRPRLGGPRRRRNTAMMFGMLKLEWCGYTQRETILKTCLFVLTEFTNRQTDRQTPHDGIGRACIASRGKTV